MGERRLIEVCKDSLKDCLEVMVNKIKEGKTEERDVEVLCRVVELVIKLAALEFYVNEKEEKWKAFLGTFWRTPYSG
ncbi:MAG: hypothetical protein QXQ53_01240 [Candidatus Methanosuratincola sp.]